MPEIYVFGGCNGSGKTTLATTFLSSLSGVEFVNAERRQSLPVVEDDDLRVCAALQQI
ncbi:MAG: hypothetical protein AAFO76_13865 [Cyanobacteria bacterium J06607_15]